jgi:hypothetical protein
MTEVRVRYELVWNSVPKNPRGPIFMGWTCHRWGYKVHTECYLGHVWGSCSIAGRNRFPGSHWGSASARKNQAQRSFILAYL